MTIDAENPETDLLAEAVPLTPLQALRRRVEFGFDNLTQVEVDEVIARLRSRAKRA